MTGLAPIAPKIARLVRLLGSDRDGEVLGAARGIRRVLEGAGLDLHVLAAAIEAPPPNARVESAPWGRPEPRSWEAIAQWCYEHDFGRLSAKERNFVENARIRFLYGEPSVKQGNWLLGIYGRLRNGGGARP